MRIGAHLSIAKGWAQLVAQATTLGCETVQIFSRSPRGGKPRALQAEEMKVFRTSFKEASISPLCVHVPYFINLGATEPDSWAYSVEALVLDLQRAQALGAAYVVTHLGRHKGDIDLSLTQCILAIQTALGEEIDDVQLLLEVSSGQGKELGASLDELALVVERLGHPRKLGFCLDTAHLHAAGYDLITGDGLDQFVDQMKGSIGVERVRLIHLNDAVHPRGARRDRHAGIGEGAIGLDAFERIINHPRLRHLPGIIETPARTDEDHRKNLEILKSLRKF